MEFTEDQPMENNQYGDKLEYNDTGPIEKSRTRTNSCWFLSFMYFMILWSGVITYAFLEGHPTMYQNPVDSSGRVCGWDTEVEKSPYLVWYNQDTCINQSSCLVCRPSCPKVNFVYENKANHTEKKKNASVIFLETRKLMICRTEINVTRAKTWDQLDYLVDNELCARSYNNKTGSGQWCGFEEKSDRFDDWRFSLPRLDKDLTKARKTIMCFIMLSGLIAILSILFLRCYAMGLTCCTLFVLYSVVFNYIYEFFVTDKSHDQTLGILLSLVISVAVLVGLVFTAAYYWQKITTTCQLLTECSKAVLNVKSSILLSIFLVVVALTVLNIGFRVSLNLSSVESPIHKVHFEVIENCECSADLNYSNGSSCDPQEFNKGCRDYDTNEPCWLSGCFLVGKELKSNWIWQIVNAIAVYWCFWFVVGFSDLTLSGVFSTWYWTFNKKILNHLVMLENFWRISAYHLGTLALGSLIILICSVIRGILKFAQYCLLKTDKPIAGLILLHLKCVFDLTGSFLDYVDRRAYVMCAIHGTDFMQSARAAHDLLSRNIEKITMNVQLSNWLLLGLSLVVSLTMSRISSSYLEKKGLTDTFAPIVLVFVGSYVACFMILRVLEIAVETIFYSSLEEGELNDGTYERPYFMSDELAKILYIKK